MTDINELARLEARAAELYAMYQRDDAAAAKAERSRRSEAATLRRRAAACHADYEAAVRDLQREIDS